MLCCIMGIFQVMIRHIVKPEVDRANQQLTTNHDRTKTVSNLRHEGLARACNCLTRPTYLKYDISHISKALLTCALHQGNSARAATLLACLRERVLLWLALCHLTLGAPASSLKCLDALLHAQALCVVDPGFARIRLEALLLCARYQVSLYAVSSE